MTARSTAAAVASGYASYGLLARPGSLPAADRVATYEQHGGFPTVAGAAILRYRLYDLDRIVRRTLAWSLLTLLLGLGYALVVLGLGRLVGRDSSLVVAAATLAVAALFQPVRRRVQELVDRRFYRRRHDAGLTIAAFGARLRDQVDLDTLTGELLAVVDQTIQPTTASLWLRPTGRAALTQPLTRTRYPPQSAPAARKVTVALGMPPLREPESSPAAPRSTRNRYTIPGSPTVTCRRRP